MGSLATILWLLILRQRNIEVSGLDYFKVGILVTPLMLVVGAFVIWLLLIQEELHARSLLSRWLKYRAHKQSALYLHSY